MAQWGKTDQANNSPNWVARGLQEGSGKAAQAANNTALYNNTSVGAFHNKKVQGVVGVSRAEMANVNGESPKVQAVGWQLRKVGMGPITSLSVTGGSGFANGETIRVSGGTVNAALALTSNATGNVVSAAVYNGLGGTFVNTSSLTFAYLRERHVTSITVTGSTSGYANTDYISAGNTGSPVTGGVNAVANISTNSIGGFVNGGITLASVGLWANTKANADIQFTIYAANGAVSGGTGATLAGVLANSSGGSNTAPVLGGRANRVTYECLVAQLSQSNGTSEDTLLPQ
jgi:hypothetical protein